MSIDLGAPGRYRAPGNLQAPGRGSEFQASGFTVQGLGFKVWGLGTRVLELVDWALEGLGCGYASMSPPSSKAGVDRKRGRKAILTYC